MKRREFIRNTGLGTLPVLGAAIIGCETTSDSLNSTDWTKDFNFMVSAAQFEAVAINTYQAAIDSALLNNAPAELDAVTTALAFKDHHQQHLNSFNTAFTGKGWDKVFTTGVSPDDRALAATNWSEVLQAALALEFDAAKFYFNAINDTITGTTVRRLFTDVFPIEVSHVVAFKIKFGLDSINSGLFNNLASGL